MCLAHPFLLSCLLIPESLRALARSLSTFGAVPQAQPVSQRSGLTTVGSSFKGSLSLSAPLVRSLNVVVPQGVSPVPQRSGLTTHFSGCFTQISFVVSYPRRSASDRILANVASSN